MKPVPALLAVSGPLSTPMTEHTPRLCIIGSPASGLAIHAEIAGLGQSDMLARITIKTPAMAQAFGNRIVRACNSHAALVAALESVMVNAETGAEKAQGAARYDLMNIEMVARAALEAAQKG